MNRKIIFFIFALVITNFVTFVVFGDWYATRMVSIQPMNYMVDAQTVPITAKVLEDFSFLDEPLQKASTHSRVGLGSHPTSHNTVFEISNEKIKPLKLFLDGYVNADILRTSQYYLDYDGQLYWMKIYSCFPECPVLIVK